jgi:site-specific recombinase XerD
VVEFEAITVSDIRKFLASHPQVSSKTIRNYHCALSALWQWAKSEGIVSANIIRDVKAPRADSRVIFPFTTVEINAMLDVAAKATGVYHGKEVKYKLVNGMDIYTLQSSLGHSSMEMVRRYLNVAQVDKGRIQRKASPVANLGT